MGAWGTALFSDDLAADLRDEFRVLVGDGLSVSAAVEKLMAEHVKALDDDEWPVFWLSLAAIQWKLGRLEDRTRDEALRVIDSGQDLERWDDAADRKKRQVVLDKLRAQLLAPPPPPKRVPRVIRSANNWAVGEVVGFQLQSERWTLLRTIGHFKDKGGRFAICELLDWVGDALPSSPDAIEAMPIRRGADPHRITQFLFEEPRKKKDLVRLRRTGILSSPSQGQGGFHGLVWPYVDRLMKEHFGLE